MLAMSDVNRGHGHRLEIESRSPGASQRIHLFRLSFALGALMLHVAKPFDHVVRTG
jgi:hypothetical protein